MSLELQLNQTPAAYQPGESITGTASWTLDHRPDTVMLRLFWFTDGKGGRDVGIVDEQGFDQPPASYKTEFSFTAPNDPWSYDGKLLSIQWAIELIPDPGENSARVDLVIAPNRSPVRPVQTT